MSKRMKRMKLMRKIVPILIMLLAASTTPVSAEVGDLLMSESYESLEVGESWNLEEGYVLTINQINIEGTKIWLSLSKYNSEGDSEVLSSGETYVYEKEIDSEEYTILCATVGEIDKESRTVRLESVRQYSDGNVAVTSAPTSTVTQQDSSSEIIALSVINSFFAPPETQSSGLAYDGTYLWLSSYMKNGGIYKLNPDDGSVSRKYMPPISQYDQYGGLTYDGSHLWQVDRYEGKLYQLNPSDCSIISSISGPDKYPSGLTWDGKYLWTYGYPSYKIYKINPSDGTIIATFDPPSGIEQNAGLAFDGTYMWISGGSYLYGLNGYIYKLNPSDCSVISAYEAPCSRPISLTWDGKYLWCASFDGGKIYQLEIGESALACTTASPVRTPATTRHTTSVATSTTNTSQQNKTSNTTLIFGGAAILIVLVLLVGKSRRKGQKATRPTSPTSVPDITTKRSRDEIRSDFELSMELTGLMGEATEAVLEKDPEQARKMIPKTSSEVKELVNLRINKGTSFPSKDTRLKEAKSIIQDAEVDLQDAMNKGVQIPQSVQRLLQDAQKEVEAGHLATAKEYASKCSEKVDAAVKDFMQRKAEQARKQRELEQMRKDASERIKSANKSIEKAEWLGITIKHAKELNAKAQSVFDANDYNSAITYANQSNDAAKNLIDESKPSISIELPSKMEYDTWKHRDLTVTNTGTAHAAAITITFLTALEVRELRTIKKLGVGEQKTLNVNIRPTEKGEVPFDYSIGFRDLMDGDYKTKDTINLQIGTGVESLEGGADMPTSNLEIKRTVYDPVNKGFVSENKLNYPEVERWVESHPPPNYWYILRIGNTGSSVEEWAVELETHLALSIKEAYIEGVDHKFDIRSEHDRYKEKHILAVLKEYGIPLPSNGVKRLYFRLNIDCATALLSRYAISGRVIANDVTLLIPEKNFPFSCELREIQAALAKDPKRVENYVKGTAEGRYDHKTAITIVNALRLYNEINYLVNNRYVDEEKLKNKIETLRDSLKTVEDQTGVKKPLELVEYILDVIMPRPGVHVHVILDRWKAINLFDVMMVDLLNVRT